MIQPLHLTSAYTPFPRLIKTWNWQSTPPNSSVFLDKVIAWYKSITIQGYSHLVNANDVLLCQEMVCLDETDNYLFYMDLTRQMTKEADMQFKLANPICSLTSGNTH